MGALPPALLVDAGLPDVTDVIGPELVPPPIPE